MPYDNEQNREIKRKIAQINRSYIAHTDMIGTSNTINYKNPSVEPSGPSLLGRGYTSDRVIGGAVGCADFKGASSSKHYEEDKDNLSGSAILGLQDGTIAGDMSKPIYRSKKNAPMQIGTLGDSMPSDIGKSKQVKYTMPSASAESGDAQKNTSSIENRPMVGAGFFDDMWSGIKSVGSLVKPFISLIPHPAAQMAAQGMDMAGMGLPVGKPKRGRPKKSCGCKKRCSCLKGGNGFAAGTFMDTGVGSTLGIKGGKSSQVRKKTGGSSSLGLVAPPIKSSLDSTDPELKPAFGNKKLTKQSTSKLEQTKAVPKAQMPSTTMAGMGKTKRAPSKRNDIVKKIMKERGVSLMDASKIVKSEGLYTK